MTVWIKKLKEEAIIPKYANPGDAGMDFFSNEEAVLNSGERKLVSTGIAMAIPEGYVGLIWDKSGIVRVSQYKCLIIVETHYIMMTINQGKRTCLLCCISN